MQIRLNNFFVKVFGVKRGRIFGNANSKRYLCVIKIGRELPRTQKPVNIEQLYTTPLRLMFLPLKEITTSKQIGKLIKFFRNTETSLVSNGGPHLPYGRLISSQADYKGCQVLKTCHSEFRHIPLMWTYKSR